MSISDIVNGRFSEASDQVFSDVDGADEVCEIIHLNSSRQVVDDFIPNLTFPPIIYGQGRGILKQRTVQIPELAPVAIQIWAAVQVSKEGVPGAVLTISDVSDVFLKLVENAVMGENGNGKMWNKEGLYFVGSGRLLIAEVAYRQIPPSFKARARTRAMNYRSRERVVGYQCTAALTTCLSSTWMDTRRCLIAGGDSDDSEG
ncbi:hypothetical protein N7522_002579 [Penicillium canescens]|nr:hypothetical protein N7522_002579 [Penicillium canescens]